MTITADQLPGILDRHAKWLRNEDGGQRANLMGANLWGADLRDANLSGANLSGANLSGANLGGANLSGAYLVGANLVGANLVGANLRDANLGSANLGGANLVGADLRGANLRDANLGSANLGDANLGDAYRCAQVQFSGHGECGRSLTALLTVKSGKIVLFCGCFTGSEVELEQYIKDGEAKYRKTRTLAMKTVLKLLAATNEDAP